MVIRRRGPSPEALALLRGRPWPKEAKRRLLGTGAFFGAKDEMEGRRGEAVDEGLTLNDEDALGHLGGCGYTRVDNRGKWHVLFIKPLHKMLW